MPTEPIETPTQTGAAQPAAARADSVADLQVEVTVYTDPLCSWSWALEPAWRRLRYEFGDRLGVRCVMGGMIPDWSTYGDPLNSVHKPAQMGPLWFQARHLTGMPIDVRIWHEDPPSSSYPACLAVKAAERQGVGVGEAYLRRLREAVMLGRRNIARSEILLAVADELAVSDDRLDAARFRDDLTGSETASALRDDLSAARRRDIGRFPTLTFRPPEGRGVMVVGYRPYDMLRAALRRVAPDLEPARVADDPISYASYWGTVLDREVAEALDLPIDETRRLLDEAAASGTLVREDSVSHRYGVPRSP